MVTFCCKIAYGTTYAFFITWKKETTNKFTSYYDKTKSFYHKKRSPQKRTSFMKHYKHYIQTNSTEKLTKF